MRCLWLTLADPDPPLNGQFLYSGGLIRAVAAQGISIDVAAFELPAGIHRDGERSGGICWHLAEHAPRPEWRSFFSCLPRIIFRTRTRALKRLVERLLDNGGWDVVVFDSITLAWALESVARACAASLMVYVAGNHEETAARELARNRPTLVRRISRFIDFMKIRNLERRLVYRTDLVTANTLEDCETFSRERPRRATAFVPPGYSGPRIGSRTIGSDVRRRVVLVGSLDWLAKRHSFERFFETADRKFADAGIELYVVGAAADDYLVALRKRARATVFTGRVEDVYGYMKTARIAVVPDKLGGFKLKGLDYVFNRLPIFAQAGSLPGMPLVPGASVQFFDEHEALAENIVRHIDNFDLLNAMQERAYAACRELFDWNEVGARLVDLLLAELRRKREADPCSHRPIETGRTPDLIRGSGWGTPSRRVGGSRAQHAK